MPVIPSAAKDLLLKRWQQANKTRFLAAPGMTETRVAVLTLRQIGTLTSDLLMKGLLQEQCFLNAALASRMRGPL